MSESSEPRWLSQGEREMWMRLVGVTFLLPGVLETQLKRDAGLSFFEYHVLAMLSEAEGRTRSMSDLARWSNSSLSRLSHVVTRLEKQGWVERRPSRENGRVIEAHLTAAGMRTVRKDCRSSLVRYSSAETTCTHHNPPSRMPNPASTVTATARRWASSVRSWSKMNISSESAG